MINNTILRLLTHLQSLTVESESERGATAVEYGLIVGLISLAIIGAITAFGNGLTAMFNDLTTQLP